LAVNAGLQTEFEFTLPHGYVDPDGTVHKRGVMRLATAMDEIALLTRVIVRLGTIDRITTFEIENLFTGDLAFLQRFYRQVNEHDSTFVEATCPHCGGTLEVDLSTLGGSQATPSNGSTRR
jgi:hypothetical protein